MEFLVEYSFVFDTFLIYQTFKSGRFEDYKLRKKDILKALLE